MTFEAISFLAGLFDQNCETALNFTSPSNQQGEREEKDNSHGRRLLYALWDAGYCIQLAKSDSSPTGYVIIPLGPIRPTPALLALYEAHHDAAVRELLEACTVGGIDPLRWHEAVDTLVTASEQQVERPRGTK